MNEDYELRATNYGLALATATDGTDLDVPPGFTIDADPDGSMHWRIAEVDCWGHDSWDDEYEGETRFAARVECWTRFARAQPEWADWMLDKFIA